VRYDARHEDIVPSERIITPCHMYRDDVRISVPRGWSSPSTSSA
jgi:hypothetical protein